MRPDQHVHKFLLSASSHFVGEFSSEDLLLTHAWPGLWSSRPNHRAQTLMQRGRKRFFVLAFRTKPQDVSNDSPLTNYTAFGEVISAILSVLYGKRFDSIGILESNGFFTVPEVLFDERAAFSHLGPFTDLPRSDLQLPLNLELFSKVSRLILEKPATAEFENAFIAAARFYQRSLQAINTDPCLAYLHLITSGEIISNLVAVDDDQLYDNETRKLFNTISTAIDGGEEVVRKLKGRLRQIKRRFSLAFCHLISDPFFQATESAYDWGCLKKEDFARRLQAAYDLRSHFVHSGIDFGSWVAPDALEIEIGTPYVIEDRKLQKAVHTAPSWMGLERIIRFALLRLLQLNGFSIDERLSCAGIHPVGSQLNESLEETCKHSDQKDVDVNHTVAILGASADRSKFGNKAVRAFLAKGYTVYPVNPKGGEVEGLAVFKSLAEIPAEVKLDRISVYLPAAVGLKMIPEIVSRGTDELWLNPGSESDELVEAAEKQGLNVIQACSIVAVGMSPHDLP